MLHLTVAVGDALVIDSGRVVIQFKQKSGQGIRMAVDADSEIPVKVIHQEKKDAPWAQGLTRKPRGSQE